MASGVWFEPAGDVVEERRSNRLARALARVGVEPRSRVGLVCCDDHAHDRAVGWLALRKLGAGAVVVPVDAGVAALRRLPPPARPSVLLACEHGVEAWRTARLPGVIVGDAVGVLWWRALEAHESPEPFDLWPPAAGDVVTRVEANGRWSLLISGPEDEVGLVAIAGA